MAYTKISAAIGHNAGVTAYAGGGQANGTILMRNSLNIVATCATPGDSVKLPLLANAQHNIIVFNDTANSCDVFPYTSSEIDSLGVNVAYALAAGKVISLVAITTTAWVTLYAT